MTGRVETLWCGGCQQAWPLLPNLVDLRTSWGRPWMHVACPGCGCEAEVSLPRDVYLGLHVRWWRVLLGQMADENRLREALGAEGAAARIGGHDG